MFFRFLATAIVVLMNIALQPLSYANNNLIKVCNISLKQIDNSQNIETKIQIYKSADNSLYSIIDQTNQGQTTSYNEPTTLESYSVRKDLPLLEELGTTKELDIKNYNKAETLIMHAQQIESVPAFEGFFKSGIDLSKVRFANIYTLNEATNMGSATIIEAFDDTRNLLGSFLGGFIVAPCK